MDETKANDVKPEKHDEKHTEKSKHDSKNKTAPKKTFHAVLNEYRGEFKKIVWPSRKDLVRKTATVIVVSLMFGVLIFAMDSIYNIGVQLFVQFVTK